MAKHRKGMCLRFPNGVIAKWPEEHAPAIYRAPVAILDVLMEVAKSSAPRAARMVGTTRRVDGEPR